MKKIIVIVFCITALIFTGTAFAKQVEFLNGTIDILEGWLYKTVYGNGGDSVFFVYLPDYDNILLAPSDSKGFIVQSIPNNEGYKSSEEAAEAMAKDTAKKSRRNDIVGMAEKCDNGAYYIGIEKGKNVYFYYIMLSKDSRSIYLAHAGYVVGKPYKNATEIQNMIESIKWKFETQSK